VLCKTMLCNQQLSNSACNGLATADLPLLNPDQAFARALLRARKMSQELLGFESGYYRTYISMLERGKMNPSLRTILSIAAALNVPAAQLVREVEQLLGSPWRRELA
jgi:DNA-binding XRE family transcriptional regulator